MWWLDVLDSSFLRVSPMPSHLFVPSLTHLNFHSISSQARWFHSIFKCVRSTHHLGKLVPRLPRWWILPFLVLFSLFQARVFSPFIFTLRLHFHTFASTTTTYTPNHIFSLKSLKTYWICTKMAIGSHHNAIQFKIDHLILKLHDNTFQLENGSSAHFLAFLIQFAW